MAIHRLSTGDTAHLDIKRLSGPDGLYRVRLGAWRLIIQWMDNRLTLLVLKLKPRGDAYK